MAETAAHVTMLQRSPTYIVSTPTQDALGNRLHRILPDGPARWLVRWINILMGIITYNLLRKRPVAMKKLLVDAVRTQLGPDFDVDKHFTPAYNPWDQRICLVPDSDLFEVLKSGRASIVTDHIESFTPTGLCLRSGEVLEADIIVTATGLVMSILKGVEVAVDGKPVQLSQVMSYKGMMFSDIPNLVAAIGYTNASWTLKCELTAEYVARLLNHMDAHNYVQCTPRKTDPSVEAEPIVNFTSGYVQRALASLPHQGSKRPWKMYQNYLLDMMTMRYGAINDGVLEFRQAGEGTEYRRQDAGTL
jgi:cation diffusion facilitator CzcD-associated flavoprotein CzcO